MTRTIKLSLWLIFILLAIFIFGRSWGKPDILLNPFINSSNNKGLSEVVNSILKDSEGRYGIVIKNLKTNETFTLNENEEFQPASLYKLKLMVGVFEQIKAGKLSSDDKVSGNIEELNRYFDIDPENAELKSGSLGFTVESALEQTITISHNYAAMILTKKINANKLAEPITAKEMAHFFENLYLGKTIDGDYSKKMLELLSRQKINDRIPKLLPEGTVVAHKTGDLGGFENDAGIVFHSSGDYIFIALSESKIPDKAGEKIAEVSKVVFEYFTQ